MPKTSVALGILTLFLAAHAEAAAPPPPDLRPLLEIQSSTLSTDSFNFGDQRIRISQAGTLLYEGRFGLNQTDPATCVTTTLALGTGVPAAFARLKQALRTGQVGVQSDCGMGFDFGENLEYSLEWKSPTGRVNHFEFGTLFRSGCPSGVALIKDAVDDYVGAVLSAPETKVVRSAPCP